MVTYFLWNNTSTGTRISLPPGGVHKNSITALLPHQNILPAHDETPLLKIQCQKYVVVHECRHCLQPYSHQYKQPSHHLTLSQIGRLLFGNRQVPFHLMPKETCKVFVSRRYMQMKSPFSILDEKGTPTQSTL